MTTTMAALMVMASMGTISSSGSGESPCELSRTYRGFATTTQCVSCHDGSTGPLAHVSFGGRGGSGHPVDVSYDAVYASSDAQLRPPTMVDPQIVLPRGLVTCVSCHDARSAAPHHVVNPARLCEFCHAM